MNKKFITKSEFVKEYGEAVTKVQAAHILGVSRVTVYRMLYAGLIHVLKCGKVSCRSLFDYLYPSR